MVNQLLPGSGLLYRYFKFKNEESLSVAQYSISQLIFYIERIFAYIVMAIFFSLLSISLNIFIIIITLVLSTLLSIILFTKRNYLYLLIARLRKINTSINNFFNDANKVFNTLIDNLSFFLLIFPLFLLQTIFECIIFYLIFNFYSYSINFEISSFLLITSTLVTILSFMNFFGLFEIVFAYSSTFFDKKFIDIVIIVFAYKVLNLLSQFLIIILSTAYHRYIERK